MFIDAHHHLWDLKAINYPWLNAKGVKRFFGDPAPIQRNYLLDEYRRDATEQGIRASVHIQVGASDPWEEAKWIQNIADKNIDWPMAQIVFCDLTQPNIESQIEKFLTLKTVRGVRQIVGRSPDEDASTGTNRLLDDSRFLNGLKLLGEKKLCFELQLIPELMRKAASVMKSVSNTNIALCHVGSPHDRSIKGLDFWSNELNYLSDLENLTCKISGLGMFEHDWSYQSVSGIIKTCLNQFGSKRCMFGSNFPVDSLFSNYQELFERIKINIPHAIQKDIFFKTAFDFYSFEKDVFDVV